MTDRRPGEDGRAMPRLPLAFGAALFVGLVFVCVVVYRGALHGPFISDDYPTIVLNPYTTARPDAWIELFDPVGDARYAMGGNYAPLPIIAHALVWRFFGSEPDGYHLVNIVVHALNAALLASLLCMTGVARAPAIMAAALFAVHPANVEAVAWISQLRSLLAMSFALAALLWIRRWPYPSAALFAAGLLCKAAALFALPMAVALWWSDRGRVPVAGAPARLRVRGAAVVGWSAVFAVYAPVQLWLFPEIASAGVAPYPDVATAMRSIAAIWARYLVMAGTGYGTAAYQTPAYVASNLDPWWLAGIVLAVALAWRIVVTLRERSTEAAWWIGAAASYAPVMQVVPFLHGIADRYLYFILPGLLGGVALGGASLVARLSAGNARSHRVYAGVSLIGATALFVVLADRAGERGYLWMDYHRLYRDAAERYPDGYVAHFQSAVDAASAGDRDMAIEHLRAAAERNPDIASSLMAEPAFRTLVGDPRFEALQRESYEFYVESLRDRARSQVELRTLAIAYHNLGDLDQAIATVEKALAMGGRYTEGLAGLHFQWSRERAEQRSARDRP